MPKYIIDFHVHRYIKTGSSQYPHKSVEFSTLKSILRLKKEDFKRLLFGYTPEEAVDKIMYLNIENFLRIYFNDGYLRGNKTPPVIS